MIDFFFQFVLYYWSISGTLLAIVFQNTMPATLNKSIFKTRSHVLFGLGTISHSRSLLQYLFLLYYESLEEADCRIVAEKATSNDNPNNLKQFIFVTNKNYCFKSEKVNQSLESLADLSLTLKVI